MTQNAVPHVEEEVVWYSIVNSSSGTALLYFRHGGGRETGDREASGPPSAVALRAVAVGPPVVGRRPSSGPLWPARGSGYRGRGSRLGPRPRGARE